MFSGECLKCYNILYKRSLSTSAASYDEHYKPVYILCQTCAFHYNYILKYENIREEEPLFIQEMEASGEVMLVM